MYAKKTCFNKAIFKSDIKRFWWISILEAIALIVFCIIPAIQITNQGTFINSPKWRYEMAICLGFSLLTATVLFSFLHSSRSVSAINSYPVSTLSLFCTKLFSGMVLMLIPVIISGYALGILEVTHTVHWKYAIKPVYNWLVLGLGYSAVSFSVTTLSAMITGNTIATVVFSLVIAFMPQLIYSSAAFVLENELYGFWCTGFDEILKNIYLVPSKITKGYNAILYPLYSVLVLFLSYNTYKRRQPEECETIIVFNKLKLVFVYFTGILAALFSYMLLKKIFDTGSIYTLIPFGIIGIVISSAILKTSFNFRAYLRPALIYTALCLIFSIAVDFDLTDFERRIPSIEETCKIEFMSPLYGNPEVLYTGDNVPEFSEPEDMKLLQKLHLELIKNRATSRDAYNGFIEIRYILNNGKSLKRKYPAVYKEANEALVGLFKHESFEKSRLPLFRKAEKQFLQIELIDKRIASYNINIPNYIMGNELIEAIQKDWKMKTYDAYRANVENCPRLHLRWEEDTGNGYSAVLNDEILLYPDYINTHKILNSYSNMIGIYSADKLEKVQITRSDNTGKSQSVSINDAKLKRNLYDKCLDELHISSKEKKSFEKGYILYDIKYCFDDGYKFTNSYIYDENNIPQLLNNVFDE